jgi:hypothetical protein
MQGDTRGSCPALKWESHAGNENYTCSITSFFALPYHHLAERVSVKEGPTPVGLMILEPG